MNAFAFSWKILDTHTVFLQYVDMSLYVLLKNTYSVENVFSSSAITFDRNELQGVSTTHWLYFNFLEQISMSHVSEVLIGKRREGVEKKVELNAVELHW